MDTTAISATAKANPGRKAKKKKARSYAGYGERTPFRRMTSAFLGRPSQIALIRHPESRCICACQLQAKKHEFVPLPAVDALLRGGAVPWAVAFTQRLGRHVVATRDISAGDALPLRGLPPVRVYAHFAPHL